MNTIRQLLKDVGDFFTTRNYKIKRLAKSLGYIESGHCWDVVKDLNDNNLFTSYASVVKGWLYTNGDKTVIIPKFNDYVLQDIDGLDGEEVVVSEGCESDCQSEEFRDYLNDVLRKVPKVDFRNYLQSQLELASSMDNSGNSSALGSQTIE